MTFSGSPTYDAVNRWVSFGMDRIWRARACRIAASQGPGLWLDACCGTGEMIRAFLRTGRVGTSMIGFYFSLPMVRLSKVPRKSGFRGFLLADSLVLPFPDNCFDGITLAFAARNLNLNREALVRTFAGFRRALVPGGRFVCVETTRFRSRLADALLAVYLRHVMVPLAGRMSGSRPAYAVLAGSIRNFYSMEDLKTVLLESGFASVECRRLCPGIVAVHVGVK